MGTGIPSPATVLFKGPNRALLSQIGRQPVNINNDNKYYEAFKNQDKKHTLRMMILTKSTFSAESAVAVQKEDGHLWMHEVITEGNSDDHQGVILPGAGDKDWQNNQTEHSAYYTHQGQSNNTQGSKLSKVQIATSNILEHKPNTLCHYMCTTYIHVHAQ